MSIFRCGKCGCIENTACSNYWTHDDDKWASPPLCSECDPSIGKWHGVFPKQSAKGMLLGSDGFLYSPEGEAAGENEWRKKHQDFKIIGPVELTWHIQQ